MQKFLTTSVFALALGLAGSALAAETQGGFQGPGLTNSTVAKVLEMKDDTPVMLTGSIEKSLGDEKYMFKDSTGSVTVEIDDDDWQGQNVTPKDTVVIKGEVDKDMFGTEVDVDSIRLKK